MISKCGEGLGLLNKIQEEDNEVRVVIQNEDYKSVYKGIIEQANIFWGDKDTIFIFDFSGMGSLADRLKKEGHKVFGGSKWADKLEHDRMFGLNIMKKVGIKVPETKEFNNFEHGRKFILENKNKRFVFKPSGDELPSKLTYSCSDCEDLLKYLDYVEKYFINDIDSFVLQEFIEGKIISSEFWSQGSKGFVWPGNHTIEVKKFMDNELGPSTGCSGNLVAINDEGCPIMQEVLKIEDECIKEDYFGCIDLNTIITKKGEIYGLEWTPRFGYDAMPTFLQLIDGDLGELFSDISRGQLKKMRLFEDEYAGGIRLTIPPYPVEPESAKDVKKLTPNLGVPIRGFKESDYDSLYFFEVMKEDNELFHSDGTGVIAVVSDFAISPEKCFDNVYKILEEVKIPDKQYRTDLAEVLPKMYHEVEELIENVLA